MATDIVMNIGWVVYLKGSPQQLMTVIDCTDDFVVVAWIDMTGQFRQATLPPEVFGI